MSLQLTSLGVLQSHPFTGFTYPYYRAYLSLLKHRAHGPAIAVGATVDGKPVGMGLVAVDDTNQTARLLSVYTDMAHRRQGIARSILLRIEEILRERGCGVFTALYETGRHYTESFEALTSKSGFPAGVLQSVVCRCYGNRLKNAPWLKKSLLPSAFEIIAWRDLSDVEKESIASDQGDESWYPRSLTPFQSESTVEPLNSLALRYDGQIVGWQINHRTAKDTIRYTSMFVREDLQRYGLALPLMIASIRRHIESPESKVIDKATFMVPAAMTSMRRFVSARMSPYLDEVNELMETTKDITSG